MSVLDALYHQVILEHNRKPHNRGILPDYSHKEDGANLSCGDEVTIYLKLVDGLFEAVSFEGEGCAISLASASLLTLAVKGKSVAEVKALSGEFKALLRGENDGAALGELAAFSGVSRLPVRVKCAALPWATLDQALADS